METNSPFLRRQYLWSSVRSHCSRDWRLPQHGSICSESIQKKSDSPWTCSQSESWISTLVRSPQKNQSWSWKGSSTLHRRVACRICLPSIQWHQSISAHPLCRVSSKTQCLDLGVRMSNVASKKTGTDTNLGHDQSLPKSNGASELFGDIRLECPGHSDALGPHFCGKGCWIDDYAWLCVQWMLLVHASRNLRSGRSSSLSISSTASRKPCSAATAMVCSTEARSCSFNSAWAFRKTVSLVMPPPLKAMRREGRWGDKRQRIAERSAGHLMLPTSVTRAPPVPLHLFEPGWVMWSDSFIHDPFCLSIVNMLASWCPTPCHSLLALRGRLGVLLPGQRRREHPSNLPRLT